MIHLFVCLLLCYILLFVFVFVVCRWSVSLLVVVLNLKFVVFNYSSAQVRAQDLN
jgi:hypothetical protein